MGSVLLETDSAPANAATPSLWLASRSPRRAELLRAAGFVFTAFDPPYDDPADPNRVTDAPGGPELARWLAERKAASVAEADLPDLLDLPGGAVLLTADTLVVAPGGGLLGTPESAAEAGATLRRLRHATHTIATGVCLRRVGGGRTSFLATARVTFGALDDALLDAYVAGDGWRGKAGGYNLAERQCDGWPVTVDGDPDAVMGLPVKALAPRLAAFGVFPYAPPTTPQRKDSAADG